MQPTRLSTEASPRSLVSPMLRVPNEILSQILALTMASNVPFNLPHFLDIGRCRKSRIREPCVASVPVHLWFSRNLDEFQEEHYLDWILMNGTCHRFRDCGAAAFFSKKILIIPLSLAKSLLDGTCRDLSPCHQATLVSQARNIITAPPGECTDPDGPEPGAFPTYDGFPRLRWLTIKYPYPPN